MLLAIREHDDQPEIQAVLANALYESLRRVEIRDVMRKTVRRHYENLDSRPEVFLSYVSPAEVAMRVVLEGAAAEEDKSRFVCSVADELSKMTLSRLAGTEGEGDTEDLELIRLRRLHFLAIQREDLLDNCDVLPKAVNAYSDFFSGALLRWPQDSSVPPWRISEALAALADISPQAAATNLAILMRSTELQRYLEAGQRYFSNNRIGRQESLSLFLGPLLRKRMADGEFAKVDFLDRTGYPSEPFPSSKNLISWGDDDWDQWRFNNRYAIWLFITNRLAAIEDHPERIRRLDRGEWMRENEINSIAP